MSGGPGYRAHLEWRSGYALSSDEHLPLDLVRNAQRAEEAGFPYALVSDHFHPWVDRQGQSPFVWSVVGAIATSTHTLRLGTGVTCPLIRTHSAIVAHAAATAAAMMPGRFFLGVGTGENLNEHVLGDRWPPTSERREMLEEAVGLMRKLWEGDLCSWDGAHYVVDNARIFTLPEKPVEVVVAAGGLEAADLAAGGPGTVRATDRASRSTEASSSEVRNATRPLGSVEIHTAERERMRPARPPSDVPGGPPRARNGSRSSPS